MKRLISIILCTVLLISVIVMPAGAAFSDITDSATSENVAILQMMGVISGYPDGTFKPGGTLTRAEFCKMAVYLKGDAAKVAQYSKLSIFPDVPGGHWAAGYVNYSVRVLSILAGRPDGKFHPDDAITYGEAITILMRMLGYTDADAGAQWPTGYINAASQIGLADGLSLSGGSAITRAQCARLLVNMLGTNLKDSAGSFLSEISAKQIEGVIIVSVNATANDGTTGCIQAAGGDTGVYRPANTIPSEFEGKRGTLVINSSGHALTFIPDKGSSRILTISEARYTYILATDGTIVTIQSDTAVYLDGEQAVYTDIWLDLRKGTVMNAYFNASGRCDYLFITTSAFSDDTVILKSPPSGTSNPFISLFGLPQDSSYTIIKNGVEVSASALRQYDVATYVAAINTFYVSDFSLSGIYEFAFPNVDTPTKVTLMGLEFDLLDTAKNELAAIALGESITLFFTDDYRVASVQKGTSQKDPPIGVVTQSSVDSTTVQLLNGMEVGGKVNMTEYQASQYLGEIVTVTSRQRGYLTLSRVSFSAPSSDYNVNAGTIDGSALSENVKIYERVGKSVPIVEISRYNITVPTVPASKIVHVDYDSSGKIDFILLDDVTGDCYSYGFLHLETKEDSSHSLSITRNYVSIKDSTDGGEYIYNSEIPYNQDGKLGGIAGDINGNLSGYVALTGISGLSRADFYGSYYVLYNGTAIPISVNVQVYIAGKGVWTDSVAEARTYSNNLDVYYDRPVSDGGKIRIIIAN